MTNKRRTIFALLASMFAGAGLTTPIFPDGPMIPEAPVDGDAAGNSMTVEEAVEHALRQSGEIDLKLIELEKAAIETEEAKAKRYPEISLTGSGSWLSNPSEGLRISKGAFGYAPTPQSQIPVAIPDRDYVLLEEAEHTYFRITTTLDQPLFTWGKLEAGVRAALDQRQIATIELDIAEREVAKRTKQAYFGALFAYKTKELLKDAEEAMNTVVDDRERSFDEGVITRQIVLEALAGAENIVLQRVKAEEGYRSAIDTLKLFTGIDGDVTLTTDFRADLPELDESRLKKAAKVNSSNRELLSRRLRQAQSLLLIETRSSPFRPDVVLSISFDITGQRIPVLGANWTDSWDVNLILTVGTSMTVLDSGRSKHSRRNAEQDVLMAQKGIEQLEDAIGLEVRSAVEKTRVTYFEVKKAEADTALAAEQYRNAKISFENELIVRQEMLGARIAFIFAQLQSLLARYTFELSLSNLEFLCGVEL